MQIESMEIEEKNDMKQGFLQANKAQKIRHNYCLYQCCGYKTYEDFTTEKQLSEIRGLVEASKMKADSTSEETKEALLTLYKNAYPGAPLPELVGEEWKTLGFQSRNPLSDLRSSGKLSLDNIVYFSDHHQKKYENMVRTSGSYPFLASAINITTLLLIHLNISKQYTFCPCCGMNFKQVKKVPVKEMATFAYFLEEQSWQTVFNELFSLGVLLMDHNYHHKVETDPTFTILDFKQVFVETKDQIMHVLHMAPRSIEDVFILAEPYLRK